MKTLAAIGAAGAVTPLGLDAIQVGLSNRAATAAMQEAPLIDAAGERITMCLLPTLDPLLTGAARVLALGRRALAETVRSLGPGAGQLRTRLALCFDEHLAPRAGDTNDPDVVAQLCAELAGPARKQWPELDLVTSTRGPAGAGTLLQEIVGALERGTLDMAILGGIHTDYDPARIAALDAAGRLFCAPDNVQAVLPGEMAAFVALLHPDTARRAKIECHAALHTIATGFEQARPDNDEPAFRATGLTAAVRSALAPLEEHGQRVGWMLTDLGFETFRHFEFQAVMTRTQRFFCEPQHVDSPAQRIGHLGAAAIPLHLVLAVEAFRRGYAPHPWLLSIAGSDWGERAALVAGALTG